MTYHDYCVHCGEKIVAENRSEFQKAYSEHVKEAHKKLSYG